MARKIGIIAIKGGVGKTTTVSTLGGVLAKDFGKKVLVVDANFSAPNLGLHFGVVKPKKSIHDVLTDKVRISEAIHEHEAGFDFLPGALMKQHVHPFKLRKKVEDIEGDYDVILFDSSPTLNEELQSAMAASDSLFVVTTPDYPTLSCTMHAVKVAKDKKVPIHGLILNKVRKRDFELTIDEIEDSTRTPVLAVLPDDVRMLEAVAYNLPAGHHAPQSDAVVEYKKLAASMLGQDYIDTRFRSRLRKAFRPAPTKDEVNRALYKDGKLHE